MGYAVGEMAFFMDKTAAGLALAALMLVAGPAYANGVEFQIRNQVMQGEDKPALIVLARKPIDSVRLHLACKGCKTIKRTVGGIPAGASYPIEFDLPAGEWRLTGEVKVLMSGSKDWLSMPLEIPVEVVSEFSIDVPEKSLDAERGQLTVLLGRDAGLCQYQVLYEGGFVVSGTQEYAGEKAGTPLPLSWQPQAGTALVLNISLSCYDAGQVFQTGIDLFPWKIAIPHEDVNFASGSAAVAAAESHKLDDALDEIQKAYARYGKWIEGVHLFVAGHTDSQGSSAGNRTLSLARAKAIADYFRDRGLRLPVFVVGMGEDSLLVQTPDNTAEEQNRRVEYILAIQPPFAAPWAGLP